jgi:acetyltransferase-like isoleucine patch superfamily enzyme
MDDSFSLIPPFYTTGGGDITVGRNVFINQNCTFYDLGAIIIGGVTIGEDSVVAAGAVVTKSVPAKTLVGGNPARVIRSIAD